MPKRRARRLVSAPSASCHGAYGVEVGTETERETSRAVRSRINLGVRGEASCTGGGGAAHEGIARRAERARFVSGVLGELCARGVHFHTEASNGGTRSCGCPINFGRAR